MSKARSAACHSCYVLEGVLSASFMLLNNCVSCYFAGPGELLYKTISLGFERWLIAQPSLPCTSGRED